DRVLFGASRAAALERARTHLVHDSVQPRRESRLVLEPRGILHEPSERVFCRILGGALGAELQQGEVVDAPVMASHDFGERLPVRPHFGPPTRMPFAGWMPFLSARTRSRYALRSKPARPQRFMTTARVEATGRTGRVVGLIGRRVFCLACPLLAEEDASRGGH